MDTVRHRVVAGAGGTLVAEDSLYRATFDADGFAVSPRGGSAFRVSTAAVGRAGATVDVHAGPWRGSGNVARRSVAPGVVEQVTATAGQVEWDMVLGARPAGRDDLRVDARVTGATGTPKQLASGWRWATTGGRNIVMGALVVKDRSGAVLHRARPRADASGVHLSVPGSRPRPGRLSAHDRPGRERGAPRCLTRRRRMPRVPRAGRRWPRTARATSWCGQARPRPAGLRASSALGSPPVARCSTARGSSSPATGHQQPAVSFDGTNYLVVWTDFRNGTADIYGTRVSTAGAVLDASGFPISTAASQQSEPAVAFNGTNYLVVWSDTAGAIYGTRVTPAGGVLDGVNTGIAISTAPGIQSAPDVTFDGTNSLVVWQDSRAGADRADVYGARVNSSGTVLDVSGIPISTGANVKGAPAVASTGAGSMVVWFDQRNVNSIRMIRAMCSAPA